MENMFRWEPDLDLAGGGFLNEVKTAGADEGEESAPAGEHKLCKRQAAEQGGLCRGQRNDKCCIFSNSMLWSGPLSRNLGER